MKKRITKIWGVGLIVAMLAGLLIAGVPAAAAPLAWSPETLPGPPNIVLQTDASANVSDVAVGSDGTTIWAAAGAAATLNYVYKSNDGGVSWTPVETMAGGVPPIEPSFVAIAPDTNDFVAIAEANGSAPVVYISTNGGATWGNLGNPDDTTVAGSQAAGSITGLALSAESAGKRYIAVSGPEAAGGEANVWYYDLGIGGAWRETSPEYSGANVTRALAVEFSPNFASDQVLTAVTGDGTDTLFNMFSLSTKTWNGTAGFSGYPVVIEAAAGTSIAADGASIALAPTYLGSDDVERVSFVGIRITGNDPHSGVYRLKDTSDALIKSGAQVYSVAYDGVTLVAGTTGTTVWRSSDSLATAPTFIPTAATKSPGGSSNTVVAWAGTTVVAGTSGDENAFSRSVDDGRAFNDISLINTSLTDIQDLAVAADGSVVYALSDDGTDTSLWRKSGGAWQRVLTVMTNLAYIVRIAPDDPDVVYVGDTAGSTTLYYSKDGGTEKWYNRAAVQVVDVGVESEDVAYSGSGTTIKRTNNGGFTWGPPKSTELVAGSVATITVLGEDQLLVGSSSGYVSYSSDGSSSWNKIPGGTGSGAAQVTASGLDTGEHIYAATSAGDTVYRWEIGQAPTVPWKKLEAPTTTGYMAYGIGLQDNALFVLTANASDSIVLRTLSPTIPDPDVIFWSSLAATGSVFDNTPSALRISKGSNVLWAATGGGVMSYTDTLSDVGPDLIGPADGTEIKMNPISGTVYDVSFTWSRLSKATKYDLWVAYDSAFDEVAARATAGPTAVPTVSYIIGPTGTTALNYSPGTTYYWRVRVASDGPIHSQWSAVRSINIEPGSAVVPSIGSPINGGTVTETPAFSWSPVSGATMYEFQLSSDTTFATTIYSEELTTTGVKPDVSLDAGTYFWRVRALEPVTGDYSTIANFTVSAEVAAPPVVVTEVPPPVINIPPAPPAQEIVIPPAPEPTPPVSQGLLLAIIIIGAVLVIAVIVLIVRTRRTV